MIATIRRTPEGRFAIESRMGGGWMFHGAHPTFAEACDAARRQCFSIRNATWDRATGGWVTADLALYPFDRRHA
jgi:hypothetical protein